MRVTLNIGIGNELTAQYTFGVLAADATEVENKSGRVAMLHFKGHNLLNHYQVLEAQTLRAKLISLRISPALSSRALCSSGSLFPTLEYPSTLPTAVGESQVKCDNFIVSTHN
jgi:hypothetical protein